MMSISPSNRHLKVRRRRMMRRRSNGRRVESDSSPQTEVNPGGEWEARGGVDAGDYRAQGTSGTS
jgi:hypothetical protein